MSGPNLYLEYLGEPYSPEVLNIVGRNEITFTAYLPDRFVYDLNTLAETELTISSSIAPYKIEKIQATFVSSSAPNPDLLKNIKGLTCSGYVTMTLTYEQNIAINILGNRLGRGLLWK